MEKKHNSQFSTNKNTKSFGKLPNGSEVFSYTLRNGFGMEVDVITYGATITSLKFPIGDKKTDVVLGFENLSDYINSYDLPSAPYFGAVVGRFAGRINNGQFAIDGQKIQLTQNHGKHQLHGGFEGFSKALWKVTAFHENENPAITLEHISLPDEEGFPGELRTKITYTLTENNELQVSLCAETSEDTIVNLTQHSYFNLDGHAADISEQQLQVNASQLLETTNENIPTGKFIALDNHASDFRTPKDCPHKIDSTFVLDGSGLAKATLINSKNQLKMSVFTNQPAIHIYVGGNCFNQIKGKDNTNYHALSGICFEAQNFPDAPNHPNFPNAILKKGATYEQHTTFKFENLQL